MKRIYIGIVVFATLVLAGVYAMPVIAAKPDGNDAGAVKYDWNLSGDVMPVPPYGLSDIDGSDIASKLIVNHPAGKITTNVTGAMNGLAPDSTYTVYLSNSYAPYVHASIGTITGFDFEWAGVHYVHSANLTQIDSSVSGDGGYPAEGEFDYAWSITEGSLIGNHIHLEMDYTLGATCTMTMDGDIDGSGTISGSWTDNCDGTRTSTWTSTGGTAVQASGNTGWTGQLAGTTPFTFTTDSYGSGSWHYNFTEFVGAFSVWINGSGGTILISDPIPAV